MTFRSLLVLLQLHALWGDQQCVPGVDSRACFSCCAPLVIWSL
uniref:Uncharacterized protein n=1 Tax=Anguilla anguilla TaxID=7936 RepID=A0A0E9XJH2_ANGAN